MARLVVDSSDEELPDLATLLKSKPPSKTQSIKPRTNERVPKKAAPLHRERPSEKSNKSAKELDAKRKESLLREDSGEVFAQKSTTRRRILNSRIENPLLLPISSNRMDIDVKRPRTKITQIKETIGSKRKIVPTKEEDLKFRNRSFEVGDISSGDDVFEVTNKPSQREPKRTSFSKKDSLEHSTPPKKMINGSGYGRTKIEELSDSDDVFHKNNTSFKSKESKKASIPKTKISKEAIQRPKQNITVKEVVSKIKSRQTTYQESDISEDEDNDAYESSGMSDFIVKDESSLFEYSEDEDEEGSILPSSPVPPKSVRKLVRGRRPELRTSMDEEHVLEQIKMMELGDDSDDMNNLGDLMSKINIRKDIDLENDIVLPRVKGKNDPVTKQRIIPPPRKDLSLTDKPSSKSVPSSFEHPSAILEFSPPRFRSPVKTKPIDPPSKQPLPSPKKFLNFLPPSPHKVTMDEFWDQEVANDWVDTHSPEKELIPRATPKKSMMPSPSKAGQSREIQDLKKFKAHFEKIKIQMAIEFVKDLDQTITNGQLSRLLQPTGGIHLEWSKRLLTTAGRAFSSRSYRLPQGKIELATKILVDEYRLLNTLCHEFCHLAVNLIDNVKQAHGKHFYTWANKIEQLGDELIQRHFNRDVGDFREKYGYPSIKIKISTKHNYEIEFKYEWQCQTPNCGLLYKRQSKSIVTAKHLCGKCRGSLLQIKPVPRSGPTAINEYAQFVKDNMAAVRAANPLSPQKDLMGILGKKYRNEKEYAKLARKRMDETWGGIGGKSGMSEFVGKMGDLKIVEGEELEEEEGGLDYEEEEDVVYADEYSDVVASGEFEVGGISGGSGWMNGDGTSGFGAKKGFIDLTED